MEIDVEKVYRQSFHAIHDIGRQGQRWKQDRDLLFQILDDVYEETLGQYDMSHMGTFAEFKENSNGNKELN